MATGRRTVVDEELRWRCAAYDTYTDQIEELEKLADGLKNEIREMGGRYTEDMGGGKLRVAGESGPEYDLDMSMNSRTSIKRENLIMAGVTVGQIDEATTKSAFPVTRVKRA